MTPKMLASRIDVSRLALMKIYHVQVCESARMYIEQGSLWTSQVVLAVTIKMAGCSWGMAKMTKGHYALSVIIRQVIAFGHSLQAIASVCTVLDGRRFVLPWV